MRTWLLRLIALGCVLMLGLSMFMSATYAWDSSQKARNDIYGSGTEKVPVILIKQEKSADGIVTGKVLPNTAFYLFQEDGVQIGGRYITDENGEIHILVNPGNYYFEEITPAVGYTYDIDENGDPITKYPFTVDKQAPVVYVHANNIPLTGDLLIRKTVENTGEAALSSFQLDTEFIFTVTFSDGGSYDYSIDGVPVGQLISGGTLKLKHGQTASFDDLPTGLLYNVVEQTTHGYIVSSAGHQGNITEEQSVADFINKVDPDRMGSLTVSKDVRGDDADLDEEFVFHISIDGATESFILRAGESRTFQGLPLGAEYSVTEVVSEDQDYRPLVQTYSGNITDTETVELPFVNIYTPEAGIENGSLTVTKEVRGDGADPSAEFEFEILFEGENVPQDQTFTLKDGESITFDDLPLGTSYVVQECELPDGYHAVVQEYHGMIVSKDEFLLPFVNIFDPYSESKTGSLTVYKDVTGEAPDLSLEFSFTATFFNGGAGEQESFVLRAGESITFGDLPHGVQYVVEEIDAAGYAPALQVVQGVIVGDESAEVTFINAVPEEPVPAAGDLIIRKTVLGDNSDPSKAFGFSIDFEGENAPDDETFTLKADESKVYSDVPDGVTFTVTETDAAGYKAVLETAEGAIIADETTEVVFTNIVPSEDPPVENICLTVRKDVAAENADLSKKFKMTLAAGDLTETFYLKAGETKEFWLPKGTVYELQEENYIAEGYSQYIENGSGAAATNVLVIVTNTYVGEETIQIPGTKTWAFSGCDDVVLPASITVRLMNGDLLVEEQVVEPDEDGVWSYLFTAPKYNSDGTEAVYTVQELSVPGFRTSYEGYDILNTYIPPVSVEFPMITKHIEGEDVPEAEFLFMLRGLTGTPMPDDAVGNVAWRSVVGEGQTSFGEISFSEPGEYTYLVVEEDTASLGWDYDSAIYTVIFTVTESETGLSCVYEILRNHNIVDEIEFFNYYEEVDLTETVMIRGEKIWNHGANPIESRPEYITILIYGNNELLCEIVVTEEDDWEYSIELPKYDANGHEIRYSVDEAEVENYHTIINGYDVINTYEPDDPSDPDQPTEPDDPDDPDRPDVPDDVPKTGDESKLSLWIGLMVVSIVGLVATLLVGRKPKHKGKYLHRR